MAFERVWDSEVARYLGFSIGIPSLILKISKKMPQPSPVVEA
jgi:hypothetical protein